MCDRHERGECRVAARLSSALVQETHTLGALSFGYDVLGLGVLVVSRDGRIDHANEVAARMLEGCGLVGRRGGHFVALGEIEGREFATQLATLATAHEGAAKAFRLESGDRWLTIRLIAVDVAERRRIVVTLDGPERLESISPEALAEAFGLTRAEARLSALLVARRPLSEVAELLGIAVETARSHLKRVMSKTGTRRQAELIAVLLTGVTSPCPPPPPRVAGIGRGTSRSRSPVPGRPTTKRAS